MNSITLPSGVKVVLKEVTGLAEKQLYSKKNIESGSNVDRFMSECIETIGDDKDTMTPAEKERALFAMRSGDRNYILVMIRVAGLGSKMDFNSKCPKCGHTSGYSVDLQQMLDDGTLKVISYEEEPKCVNLPSGGYAEILYLTGEMERAASKLPNDALHAFMLLRIASINGERPNVKTLESMSMTDLCVIRESLAEMQGGLMAEIELDCPNCNESYEIGVHTIQDFLAPMKTKTAIAGA